MDSMRFTLNNSKIFAVGNQLLILAEAKHFFHDV
jgi:hypothetical protein